MSKIKKTFRDKIFYTVNTLFLIICIIIVLYPLIYIVSSSFSDPKAVSNGKVWLLPVGLSLEGYKAVFKYKSVWTGYGNTIIYTLFGTAINVVMTILAAYPLSRKDLKGRNTIMFIFAFTMLFSGGLIPTYILISNLGMINTRWAMVIPGALSVWNMIITRTYYQSTIPTELLEASKIDGCSDIKFVLKVVLPLSGAITAVNVLFYSVGHWNSFFNAFIYLHNPKLQPLQIVLRDILIINNVSTDMFLDPEIAEFREYLKNLLKYSLIIVSSLPVLCMYPFLQKYFVKGVMLGGIKG